MKIVKIVQNIFDFSEEMVGSRNTWSTRVRDDSNGPQISLDRISQRAFVFAQMRIEFHDFHGFHDFGGFGMQHDFRFGTLKIVYARTKT